MLELHPAVRHDEVEERERHGGERERHQAEQGRSTARNLARVPEGRTDEIGGRGQAHADQERPERQDAPVHEYPHHDRAWPLHPPDRVERGLDRDHEHDRGHAEEHHPDRGEAARVLGELGDVAGDRLRQRRRQHVLGEERVDALRELLEHRKRGNHGQRDRDERDEREQRRVRETAGEAEAAVVDESPAEMACEAAEELEGDAHRCEDRVGALRIIAAGLLTGVHDARCTRPLLRPSARCATWRVGSRTASSASPGCGHGCGQCPGYRPCPRRWRPESRTRAPLTASCRPRGVRRARARQPDALRQHGRADEVLLGRDRPALAARNAVGQAGSRVLLQREPARRPGDHARFDDAAASAPRHADRRPALHRTGADGDRDRRHALRREPRRRRRLRPPVDEAERTLCIALGRRLAGVAKRLAE